MLRRQNILLAAVHAAHRRRAPQLPQRRISWKQKNIMWQPPLMLKELTQAVCGGPRWNQVKLEAELKATEGVLSGVVKTSNSNLKAMGLPTKGRVRKKQMTPPSSSRELLSDGAFDETRRDESYKKDAIHQEDLVMARDARRTDIIPDDRALVPAEENVGTALLVAEEEAHAKKRQRIVSYDVLDCTFGCGVHSGVVLEFGAPYTRIAALDCDYGVVNPFVNKLTNEFGGNRMKFFVNRMSEIHSMFGHKTFDAVMIDPGFNTAQITDPARGFMLHDIMGEACGGSGHAEHLMDLRYGPQMRSSLLDALNQASRKDFYKIAEEFAGLKPHVCKKFAGVMFNRQPFKSSVDVLKAIEATASQDGAYPINFREGENIWLSTDPMNKLPNDQRLLHSLRIFVNNEDEELRGALKQAFEVVKAGGRIVVFTRFPHEVRAVKKIIASHPFCMHIYTEKVSEADCDAYAHRSSTLMWVLQRTRRTNAEFKNMDLSEKEVRETHIRHMIGAFEDGVNAYPLNNFTAASRLNADDAEQASMRKNRRGPKPQE